MQQSSHEDPVDIAVAAAMSVALAVVASPEKEQATQPNCNKQEQSSRHDDTSTAPMLLKRQESSTTGGGQELTCPAGSAVLVECVEMEKLADATAKDTCSKLDEANARNTMDPIIAVEPKQSSPSQPSPTSLPSAHPAPAKSQFRIMLDAGLSAMKKNLLPGFILQLLALSVILSYFLSDSAHKKLDALADLKERIGFGFSAVSSAIAGGILPWLILCLKRWIIHRKLSGTPSTSQPSPASTTHQSPAVEMSGSIYSNVNGNGSTSNIAESATATMSTSGSDHRPSTETTSDELQEIRLDAPLDGAENGATTSPSTATPSTAATTPSATATTDNQAAASIPSTRHIIAEGVWMTLFWTIKGIEVDAFYRLQGLMWGNDGDASTIATKVAVDQFIYNPVWAAPSVIWGYAWMDAHFTWRGFKARMGGWKYFWCFLVPQTLMSTWIVWIPATSMIYALPATLQIPLFEIVLCFWSLVLAIMNDSKQ